jgi:uncharacterized protein (TIGR03086 family)
MLFRLKEEVVTRELTTWTVLQRSHVALRTAIGGVPDGGWTAPTPCEAWTVTQVLQHAAGDQQGYAAVLTGDGFPTEDPFAPSGRLAGSPADLLEPALAAAAAAFGAVQPGQPAVAVPLPGGPFPAETAVGACGRDAAVHAWDIAVATGQPSPVDDALAAELLPTARAIVDPLRGFAYAPALPGDSSDGALDELLRYLGRNPRWTPAG